MFRRLVAPFREFGLAAGAIYLLDRSLRALSPRLGLYVYELMVQPVSAGPLLAPRLLQNLEFVEIGPRDTDLARIPVREEIKVSRFEQGAHCLGVYRKGVLIGYCWFCFGAYEEDEVRCTYDLSRAEPAAWDFDLYVFPESRMGLGFSAVWHGAFEYLRGQGVEHSYSRVTQFNLASRRAHARLGSTRVGRAVFLKIWRIEMALASVAPYVGMTWTAQQRLILRMPAHCATLRRSERRERTSSAAPPNPTERGT
jgi:hypothetical protein